MTAPVRLRGRWQKMSNGKWAVVLDDRRSFPATPVEVLVASRSGAEPVTVTDTRWDRSYGRTVGYPARRAPAPGPTVALIIDEGVWEVTQLAGMKLDIAIEAIAATGLKYEVTEHASGHAIRGNAGGETILLVLREVITVKLNRLVPECEDFAEIPTAKGSAGRV